MRKRAIICLILAIIGWGRAEESAVTDEAITKAVDRGLAWIAQGQAIDGSFGTGGQAQNTPGIWALCGMAFLARGHLPGTEPYGTVVEKIISRLAAAQREDGYLGGNDGKMYSHCIATLFLSEVSGMVNPELQKTIDTVLPKALKIILNAQAVPKDPEQTGGWRYAPDSRDSDFSCSGWALMALRSARLNGAQVPPEAIKKAVAYILRRHDEKQGCFGSSSYFSIRKRTPRPTAGLACSPQRERQRIPAPVRVVA